MADEKQHRRARRSFTDDFRAGAVRLVLDEGKTVMQVARDLDLTASALRQWVARARADRSKGKTGLTTEERAELARAGAGLRKDRAHDLSSQAAVRALAREVRARVSRIDILINNAARRSRDGS